MNVINFNLQNYSINHPWKSLNLNLSKKSICIAIPTIIALTITAIYLKNQVNINSVGLHTFTPIKSIFNWISTLVCSILGINSSIWEGDLKGEEGLQKLKQQGIRKIKGSLDLRGVQGVKLPIGLKIEGDLSLAGCTSLTTLPKGLEVGGYLSLDGCTSLATLPEA